MSTRPLPSTGIEALDRAIKGTVLPDENRSAYATVLEGLLDGTRARPGLDTLHHMLCERLAFTFARTRMLGAMPSAYAPDLDRSNKLILEWARTLIAEAKVTDADAAARNSIIRNLGRTVLGVIDDADCLSEDQRLRLKEDLHGALTAEVPSLEEARRILGGLPSAPPGPEVV